MRLIVTGASGVLGSELIRQTMETAPQTEIVAVARQTAQLPQQWHESGHVACRSWAELAAMELADGDVVVHCAFPRKEDGQALTEALTLTASLLKKVGTSGKQVAVVGISSRSVYGQNPETPWRETTPPMPNAPYALAKMAQELLIRQAAEAYGFSYTLLRLAGLIGVGMEARLVSQMTMRAIRDRALTVMGGQQQFAMLDIRDAAAGIRALLCRDPAQWETLYNLGAPAPVLLRDMAEVIRQRASALYGWRVTVSRQDKDVSLLDAMDCTKFYTQMNWKPRYTLADTVDHLFASYRTMPQ